LWDLPDILIFNINNWIDIDISLTFIINTEVRKYILKGVIYLGDEHFTSRMIDNSGMIWYHDGISTKSQCISEFNVCDLPNKQWLKTINRNTGFNIKEAVIVIYIRE
jgi:hypothetical protein